MSESNFIDVSNIHKSCFDNSWGLKYLSLLMKNKINDGFIAKLTANTNIKKHNKSKYNEIDKCIGFILFSKVHEYSELISLGVLPNWRCNGIGSNLIQHVISFIQRSGANRLVLEVAENNLSARKLYSDLDFKEISQRIGYYKQSKGNVDALILEKKI